MAVMAILAILMSFVGVMVAGAKSDAKKASCAFNLRQMSIGVNTYLQDYNDQYPQTKGHSSSNPSLEDADGSIELPTRGSMLTMLGNYSTGLENCASDPDVDDTYCETIPSTPGSINSYNVNGYFVWGLNQSEIYNGVSSTILVAERRNSASKNGAPPNCDVIYRPWYNPGNPLAPANDMDEFDGALDTRRHQGGANYLFADGHAAFKLWGQVYGPTAGVNYHLPY